VLRLADLENALDAYDPLLGAHAARVAANADAVAARLGWDEERLGAEQARLGALTAPDGLEELDARRRGAGERVQAARVRFTDAEAADDTARALLAEAPERASRERSWPTSSRRPFERTPEKRRS